MQDLDLTKLKAFADNKLGVDKIMIFLHVREENIVGKGMFSKGFPQEVNESRDCVEKS